MGEKLRFSGMSTPNGMSLYGRRYKADINSKYYHIGRGGLLSPIMFFPLFDIGIIAIFYLVRDLNEHYNISSAIDKMSSILYPAISLVALIGIVYAIVKIPDILAALRRFRLWHGCEHMIIAAAENNNVGEARKYSRINDRCGATFMLTIFITYALWVNFIGPFGVFSMTFLVMMTESRIFHKYNVPGIYIGRVIQEYATTAEPPDVMLNMGENAMGELIMKEVSP